MQSDNIKDLILGDTSGLKPIEIIKNFKDHVKSHLFVDDTISGKDTYIFFDVIMPDLRSQTKEIQIIVYGICHRELLENYSKEGYFGNRADILSEMIEETLLDESIIKQFGIGDLKLNNVQMYNSDSYYGCVMVFSVCNFR